ncbi:MAG: hypothetical protein QW112_01975 [Candidatus Micrarchaeia archaeon]
MMVPEDRAAGSVERWSVERKLSANCRGLRNPTKSGCWNAERTRRRFFKAQVSFEFLSLFIVIIFAFLFFFAIYSQFSAIAYESIKKDRARAVAYSIADIVNAILPYENITANLEIQHGYTIAKGVRSIVATDSDGFAGSAPVLTDMINISVATNATSLIIRKETGMVYING